MIVQAHAEEDLNTELERTLGKLVKDKYKTDFYAMTRYPLAVNRRQSKLLAIAIVARSIGCLAGLCVMRQVWSLWQDRMIDSRLICLAPLGLVRDISLGLLHQALACVSLCTGCRGCTASIEASCPRARLHLHCQLNSFAARWGSVLLYGTGRMHFYCTHLWCINIARVAWLEDLHC